MLFVSPINTNVIYFINLGLLLKNQLYLELSELCADKAIISNDSVQNGKIYTHLKVDVTTNSWSH